MGAVTQKAKRSEYNQRYYQTHREERQEYGRQYRQTHKEKRREYDQKRYQAPTEARRETSRKCYQSHKEQRIHYWRAQYQQVKAEVLTYYGGCKLACIKCGFSNPDALCIDHIDNNGAEQRRILGMFSGKHMYYWLRRNGFPLGYQTLCCNCNTIKAKQFDVRRRIA